MRAREEPSLAPVRRVYVMYEGRRTERDYFTCFSRAWRSIGKFDLIELSKDGFDADRTDRLTMVEMARGHMAMVVYGRFTPFLHVTTVLRNLWTTSTDTYLDPDTLDRVRRRIMRTVDSRGPVIDGDGMVSDDVSLNEIIRDELGKSDLLTGEDDGIFNLGTYIPKGNSYEPSKDRVFVVFDRDLDPNCPELRTDEEYGRVLNMCQNLGFEPLVSTPMFEFWLLLHHESVDVTAYGPSLLYKNDILRDLESLEGGRSKGISQRRFDRFYLGTFPRAVDASRAPPLTTDPRRLVDTPGTNVGVELESLLS